MNIAVKVTLYTAITTAAFATLMTAIAFPQEPERVECDLYVQPNALQRLDVGDKITLTAQVTKPEHTRAIGIATNLEIVGIETNNDYLKYTVKARPEQSKQIEHAEQLSRLWFSACKYDGTHDAILENDVSIDEFLKQNTEYRPCDERDWGYGGMGPRAEAPKFLVKNNAGIKTEGNTTTIPAPKPGEAGIAVDVAVVAFNEQHLERYKQVVDDGLPPLTSKQIFDYLESDEELITQAPPPVAAIFKQIVKTKLIPTNIQFDFIALTSQDQQSVDAWLIGMRILDEDARYRINIRKIDNLPRDRK